MNFRWLEGEARVEKDGKVIKEKFRYDNFGDVAVFQDCFGNELSLTSISA